MPICFYCGQNHSSGHCPKHFEDKITDAITKQNNTLETIGNQQISVMESMSRQLATISSDNERHTREIINSVEHLEERLEMQHYEIMEAEREKIGILYSIVDCIKNPLTIEYVQRIAEGYKNLQDGRFEFAIKAFNKAEELKSDDPLVYIYRGHAYVRSGKLDEALKDFEEAFKISVYDDKKQTLHKSYCLFLISRAHFCKGDIAIATSKIRQAISLNPFPAEYNYQLAACIARSLK